MKKYLNVNEIETIRCSVDEAETTIGVERNNNIASIYTSDNVMLTKLKRQMSKNNNWKCWEAGRNSEGEVTGYFFEVPKRAISIRTGNKREVSDESKEAASIRFKEMHRSKKNG